MVGIGAATAPRGHLVHWRKITLRHGARPGPYFPAAGYGDRHHDRDMPHLRDHARSTQVKNGPEQVQNGDTFTNATDRLLDYLFGLERAATAEYGGMVSPSILADIEAYRQDPMIS